MGGPDPAGTAPQAGSPPEGLLPHGVQPDLLQGFDRDGLYALRSAVAAHASEAGLPESRVENMVVAAHELAANAVRHAGGRGVLALWRDGGTVYCRVADQGNGIQDARAGLELPDPHQVNGRGLWMARRLCDGWDVRTGPQGTVITVSMSLAG